MSFVMRNSATAIDALVHDSKLAPRIYRTIRGRAAATARRLRLIDRYTFEDRRRASSALVCVICGIESEFTPVALKAIAATTREQSVCLVSPGYDSNALRAICRQLAWSYMSTGTADQALAQNICYRLHPYVETIVKIDDSIVVLPGSVDALVERLRRLKKENILRPGAVAPFVPLDPICHRQILDALGLWKDYEDEFGRTHLGSPNAAIETDPNAAVWVWRHTAPLARTAERLACQPETLLMAPVRFHAGMVAFERSYWEEIGYFPVRRWRVVFGQPNSTADADAFSTAAFELSRPIVFSSHILAGRLAFPRQREAMSCMVRDHSHLFFN